MPTRLVAFGESWWLRVLANVQRGDGSERATLWHYKKLEAMGPLTRESVERWAYLQDTTRDYVETRLAYAARFSKFTRGFNRSDTLDLKTRMYSLMISRGWEPPPGLVRSLVRRGIMV